MGVVTTTDVKAGDELFTYYGYSSGLSIPADFPWYWEMKKEIEEKENLEAKNSIR